MIKYTLVVILSLLLTGCTPDLHNCIDICVLGEPDMTGEVICAEACFNYYKQQCTPVATK